MKMPVVRDESNKVVHIGPWDERIDLVESSQYEIDEHGAVKLDEERKPVKLKVTVPNIRNRMPSGYTVSEAEIVTGPDGGLYAAEEYASVRRASYPQIADQLDAIWKGGAEAEAMRARVLDVKQQFPKPGNASQT